MHRRLRAAPGIAVAVLQLLTTGRAIASPAAPPPPDQPRTQSHAPMGAEPAVNGPLAASSSQMPAPNASAAYAHVNSTETSDTSSPKTTDDPRVSWWTMVFTGTSAGVALLALFVTAAQALLFRRQLAIMREQIATAHHPEINITNVVIYAAGGHDSACLLYTSRCV